MGSLDSVVSHRCNSSILCGVVPSAGAVQLCSSKHMSCYIQRVPCVMSALLCPDIPQTEELDTVMHGIPVKHLLNSHMHM